MNIEEARQILWDNRVEGTNVIFMCEDFPGNDGQRLTSFGLKCSGHGIAFRIPVHKDTALEDIVNAAMSWLAGIDVQ